jgi:uncharacterized protein YdeI (YjbR/CyaY-like superfamily)
MTDMQGEMQKVLRATPEALQLWGELTAIGQRDYITWVNSAKLEKTRASRLARIPSMLVSGKKRPCCYAVVPLSLYTAINANPKAKIEWRKCTADQKRDFTDWVSEVCDTKVRAERVQSVCEKLLAGKFKM